MAFEVTVEMFFGVAGCLSWLHPEQLRADLSRISSMRSIVDNSLPKRRRNLLDTRETSPLFHQGRHNPIKIKPPIAVTWYLLIFLFSSTTYYVLSLITFSSFPSIMVSYYSLLFSFFFISLCFLFPLPFVSSLFSHLILFLFLHLCVFFFLFHLYPLNFLTLPLYLYAFFRLC
ncbi:hypothetical protein DFS34DRAFT_602919 [Phlyctochytrium arcticum]|nr:hypothetical protein DFS34DRAFT_602919 [Phlyctochytrium arcticum]